MFVLGPGPAWTQAGATRSVAHIAPISRVLKDGDEPRGAARGIEVGVVMAVLWLGLVRVRVGSN